jgi:hypothetical protein
MAHPNLLQVRKQLVTRAGAVVFRALARLGGVTLSDSLHTCAVLGH